MALAVETIKEKEAQVGKFEITERLWLTADGERVVPEGHPEAATLYATPGKRVPLAEAERYGLTGPAEVVGPEAKPVAKAKAKPRAGAKAKPVAKA